MKRLLIIFLTVILTLVSNCTSDNLSTDDESSRNKQETVLTEESDPGFTDDLESLPEKENTTHSQSNELTAENALAIEQRSDADTSDNPKADTSPESAKPSAASEQPKLTIPPEPKSEKQTPNLSEKDPPSSPKETERLPDADSFIPSADTHVTEPETVLYIDISQYIDYVIVCGKEHGLGYDSSATACWDNPLIISTNDSIAKRDINNLFDWYQTQGFTKFSVWAEERLDGKYDLFIGYA